MRRKLVGQSHSTIISGSAAIALLLIVIMGAASFSIYKNMKADNIGHYGTLTVDHCTHVGPWDFSYRCYGSWQQGAGLVIQPNAVVDVTGLYDKGAKIPDIYPMSSSDAAQISSVGPLDKTMQFTTGADRRGVMNNLLSVIIIVVALELLLALPFLARLALQKRLDNN